MSMDNIEINKRDNKGVKDIIETDESCNGVFTIDERHLNGYHLYIPYGLHFDLHEALYKSIRLLIDEII